MKVPYYGNNGLANIGGETDKKRTGSLRGSSNLVVPCFAQQNFELWAHRFEPCVNPLGAERLACPVDEPSPRRVKPCDPAKIENNLPRPMAIRHERIRPRLDGRRAIHRPTSTKGER